MKATNSAGGWRLTVGCSGSRVWLIDVVDIQSKNRKDRRGQPKDVSHTILCIGQFGGGDIECAAVVESRMNLRIESQLH
jgi:hypothetical protein